MQDNKKKKIEGLVVKRSGDKTISVEITRQKGHPLYHKRIKTTTKYLVHDPMNTAKVGETVTIVESRPLSRRKRWVLFVADKA